VKGRNIERISAVRRREGATRKKNRLYPEEAELIRQHQELLRTKLGLAKFAVNIF
jgi:hypothetical protein